MVLGTVSFAFWRTCEILTLIPVIGMTAWFVNGFQVNSIITPSFVLCLFIVSVLAGAWAISTLFRLRSTKRSAIFVSFIDLCFVGAFIASVVLLSDIGNADCTNFSSGGSDSIYGRLGPFGQGALSYNYAHKYFPVNRNCLVLKASWAFGIMNAVFFFFTFILAIFLHRRERETVVKERTVRRSRHSSRHGGHSSASRHRSSSSRRRYYV